MAIVYLDTSAFNELGLDLHIIAGTGEFEFLLSSCQIDEFACADPAKEIWLSALAWEITNRRKLLEHIQIMYLECAAELGLIPPLKILDDYCDPDPVFVDVWKSQRYGETPIVLSLLMKEVMAKFKESYEQWSKKANQPMRDTVQQLKKLGIHQDWKEFLGETETEGWFNQFIYTNLSVYPHYSEVWTKEDIFKIEYRRLRCTSVGLQYYLATEWLDVHGEGKSARITRGEQVDVRHVFYAGLADYFVTGDGKMRKILTDMVSQNPATVLSPQEFRNRVLGWKEKHEMPPELWVKFALGQLLSVEWRHSIERFYKYVASQLSGIPVPREHFSDEILGAQLALLGFVCIRSDVSLGLAFHSSLASQSHQTPVVIPQSVHEAHSVCYRKIGDRGRDGLSADVAAAIACAERVDLAANTFFMQTLKMEFGALMATWLMDIAQYKFPRN